MRKRVSPATSACSPPRDRGPERRYARDLVDSRHTVGEYFLFLAIVVLVLGLIRSPADRSSSRRSCCSLIVLALVVDSFRIYAATYRAVREKFPNGDVDGVGALRDDARDVTAPDARARAAGLPPARRAGARRLTVA